MRSVNLLIKVFNFIIIYKNINYNNILFICFILFNISTFNEAALCSSKLILHIIHKTENPNITPIKLLILRIHI